MRFIQENIAYFACAFFAGLGVWLSLALNDGWVFFGPCALNIVIVVMDFYKCQLKNKP